MKKEAPKGFVYIKYFLWFVVIASVMNIILVVINNPLRSIFVNLLSDGVGGITGGIIYTSISLILGTLFIIGYKFNHKLAWYSALIYFICIGMLQIINITFLKWISILYLAIAIYVVYYIISKRNI